MTPEHIDRVFGRGRLRMVTGDHVEVFREAAAPGERRRYTKRFLATADARLPASGPSASGASSRASSATACAPCRMSCSSIAAPRRAGAGADLRRRRHGRSLGDAAARCERDGRLRHVFEDCAHWWALAHHCAGALDAIHACELVHLDLKADNVCIPLAPAVDPLPTHGGRAAPAFEEPRADRLRVFAGVRASDSPRRCRSAGKPTTTISRRASCGRSRRAHAGDLAPTRELDWRCDILQPRGDARRYLPDESWACRQGVASGWTARRYEEARTLVYRLREAHDGELAEWRPHTRLLELTHEQLAHGDLQDSLLAAGWTLARDVEVAAAASFTTPLTCIAPRRALSATPATPMRRTAAPAVFRTTRVNIDMADSVIPDSVMAARPARVARASPRGVHVAMVALATAVIAAVAVALDSPGMIEGWVRGVDQRVSDMRAMFGGAPATVTETRAPAKEPATVASGTAGHAIGGRPDRER